jgi:SAM-dependent methyltransferase
MKQVGRGRWRHLLWRANLMVRGVDLAFASEEQLGLPDSSLHYRATSGPDFAEMLRQIGIPQGSKIVDIGCGKGISLITMAKFPFSRIDGCDLSPELIRTAEANIRRLNIKGVNLYCCDASKFTELDEYTHIYFYNPFTSVVFKPVMDNILSSLDRNPRKLTIIYHNPTCHDVIAATSVFDKVKEYHYGVFPCYVYVNRHGGQ